MPDPIIVRGWKILPRSYRSGTIEDPEGWKTYEYIMYKRGDVVFDWPERIPIFVKSKVFEMTKRLPREDRLGADEPVEPAGESRKVQEIKPCAYPGKKKIPSIKVDTPTLAAKVFRDLVEDAKGKDPNFEIGLALFMNARNDLVGFRMFEGTVDSASVYPREILQAALAAGCVSAVFVHNHPSGYVDPSPQDIALCRSINDALKTVRMQLQDSVVVATSPRGEKVHMSMRESGLYRP